MRANCAAAKSRSSSSRQREDTSVAVALGKRYKDENTGIEVLCIKPGDCNLNVDGRGMEELQPKVLPSAD